MSSDESGCDGVPSGLAAGGRGLWAALIDRDPGLADPLNPAQASAIEACRAKDRCDVLDEVCRTEDVMIDNGKGQPVAHPAWVEARQQANILKQLLAALRLPDEQSGKRPQHRGARGAYAKTSAGAGSARARLRAAG